MLPAETSVKVIKENIPTEVEEGEKTTTRHVKKKAITGIHQWKSKNSFAAISENTDIS